MPDGWRLYIAGLVMFHGCVALIAFMIWWMD